MATRLYLVPTATSLTVAPGAAWTDTAGIHRCALTTDKGVGAVTLSLVRSGSVANQDLLNYQGVSAPLAAAVDFTGATLAGGLNAKLSAAQANCPTNLSVLVRVVSGDGATVRGTLLAYAPDDLLLSGGNAADARLLPNAGTPVTNAVQAQAGDRIIVEVGYHVGAATTSANFYFMPMSSEASDISADGSNWYLNTWVELSSAMTFTTIAIDQADPQSVAVGATLQLSATVTNPNGTTTWASSNTAVATVDASGRVTGVASGSAVITATNNGASSGITVNVAAGSNTPPTVTINEAGVALPVGASFDYTASATDPEDGDLTTSIAWSVSNGSVLQITGSATGGSTTVKKIAAGSADLRADVVDSQGAPAATAHRTIADPAVAKGTFTPGSGATMIISKNEPTAALRTVLLTLYSSDGSAWTGGDAQPAQINGAIATNALAAVSAADGVYSLVLAATEVAAEGAYYVGVSGKMGGMTVQVTQGAVVDGSGLVGATVNGYATGQSPSEQLASYGAAKTSQLPPDVSSAVAAVQAAVDALNDLSSADVQTLLEDTVVQANLVKVAGLALVGDGAVTPFHV